MIIFALNNKCLHLSFISSPWHLHILNSIHWCFHLFWTFYFKLYVKYLLNILGIFYQIIHPKTFLAILIFNIYILHLNYVEGVSFFIFMLRMKYKNITFHYFITLINNWIELIEIIITHSSMLYKMIYSKVSVKCGQNCSMQ